MNPALIGVIAIIVVVGAGWMIFSSVQAPPATSPAQEQAQEETMNNEESMMPKEEGMMKGKPVRQYSGAVLAGTSAPLLDFKKADYEEALRTDKLIVLYFYANWCPICRAEFPIMQDAFNKLTTDKAIGFRVNYNDNETDADERALAREFGVAYQHTKVFVKGAQRILKSPEGWNAARYEAEIQKALPQ